MSNLCMNCFREPEPFETDKETCYWMVIPKDEDGPIALMSNLDYNFVVCPDREYEAKNGETFICVKCFERMTEGE